MPIFSGHRSKWGTFSVFSISVVKIVANVQIQCLSFVSGRSFKDKVFACLKNVDTGCSFCQFKTRMLPLFLLRVTH